MTAIAIIGASRDRSKFGNKAVRAYIEHGDTVYPVNPIESEVEGLPAYPSVLNIPDPVDVANFYVPPHVGLQVIEAVAQKGIPRVLLNPGSYNDALLARCAELGLEAVPTCSIRLIGRSPAEF